LLRQQGEHTYRLGTQLGDQVYQSPRRPKDQDG
jgi:hypothetical protein